MVSLDDAVIAKLEKGGDKFEILVDPDKARVVKEGKDVPIEDLLVIESIFADSKKGEHASEKKLQDVFGTQDVGTIAVTIIRKGEIQLTTQQKKKMLDDKKKQIVEMIARNAINPQTNTPHPPLRIEMAMEEAKVHIDPFKSVETQVNDVLKALQKLIPIRFEKVTLAIKVPGTEYPKIFAEVKNSGRLLKEEWQSDGSWIALVEIPAGIQTDLIMKLQGKTKGQVDSKVVKR
jgi:ribosome maturation protein SDO1